MSIMPCLCIRIGQHMMQQLRTHISHTIGHAVVQGDRHPAHGAHMRHCVHAQTTHQTAHGQLLDITTAPIGTVDLSKYTEATYMRIVTFKTAFYSFYLPVVCGLLVGGVTSQEAFGSRQGHLHPDGPVLSGRLPRRHAVPFANCVAKSLCAVQHVAGLTWPDVTCLAYCFTMTATSARASSS